MAHATRRFAFLVLLTIALAGCAARSAVRLGQDAELAQEYDRAVLEYTRALQADPDDRDARQGLARSKVRAALEHFTRARRLEIGGRLDEAVVELQLAAQLNPTDPNIEDLLADVQAKDGALAHVRA
jgi:tetratricopeptide (TPR) repeat protein